MFLMTIALAVYNLAEEELRKILSASGESIPAPGGKPMKNPTLDRLFHLFARVTVLVGEEGGERIHRVMNLNDTLKRVLVLLGENFERYYMDGASSNAYG